MLVIALGVMKLRICTWRTTEMKFRKATVTFDTLLPVGLECESVARACHYLPDSGNYCNLFRLKLKEGDHGCLKCKRCRTFSDTGGK